MQQHIALSGTPRQIERQLSMLVDPSEPFRPEPGRYTGSKLWAAGETYALRQNIGGDDAGLFAETMLCLNPIDAPTRDWWTQYGRF